ncbi:CFEM domain-containing protein [Fusarium falciforme]|uniref:CFEM domain-containing protein n=1 Tax=Fusarium falciforme TaxID=195108 RepID=UPI00230085AB|nr:CFEM domain-containing protein [Fusarium falciforme]WAO95934.1 CFEM domain-containing protein [Fusarium falciforme]
MKTSTSIRLAAAGVIGLASMAQAQSVCAINCFQGVITDHPPLDCTEENMYLCFCKRSNLQNWFAECIWDECGSQSEAAIAFGVNLCADYGITITPPTKPEEQPTTTKAEPKPTTQAEEEPEETQAEEEPESTRAETQPTSTKAEEQPEETQAEETEAEETKPAEETKATTAAAPAETSAETEKPAAPKPTTVVVKPSHADNTTVVSPTNPPTVVNMGASNAASGILAAAGLAVAAFQLL